MKKVIIMTVGLGGGHKAMARNLTEVLKNVQGDLDIKTVDVLAEAWPAFNKATTNAYAGSTSGGNSWMFRLYYVLSDRFPQPLQWFANLAFRRYARRKYAVERPDLIIATYPFLAEVAARARDYHHGTTPIILTVTDARHVQGIWLTNKADKILTATADTVEYMVRRGVDKERVTYLGFPAGKKFYESTSQVAISSRLGLDGQTFTIILTAGGMGLNHSKVLAVATAIAKLRVPYQIILNAGSNDKLREQFQKISFPYAVKVIVEGFTDKMPDYMRASDVICCKSGWLTVNEALVMQRPLILYDAIPGHEEQNVRYVVENNFGVYEPDPSSVAAQIGELITSPQRFQSYKQSMERAHTNHDPYDRLAALYGSYLLKS